MAYDTKSLNVCIPRLGAGVGGANAGKSAAIWMYVSDDDPATVIAAGYVTDGDDKGVKVNDCVIIVDDDGVTVDLAVVTVVDSAGLVTMINGT